MSYLENGFMLLEPRAGWAGVVTYDIAQAWEPDAIMDVAVAGITWASMMIRPGPGETLMSQDVILKAKGKKDAVLIFTRYGKPLELDGGVWVGSRKDAKFHRKKIKRERGEKMREFIIRLGEPGLN